VNKFASGGSSCPIICPITGSSGESACTTVVISAAIG
jgi:hypothetical protein